MLRGFLRAAVAGASAIVLLAPAQASEPDVGRASWTGLYLGLCHNLTENISQRCA